MRQLVILGQREQEYLLRAIEAAVNVRDARQFFLWAQGQLQALLPHRVMVCLQFDGRDALVRLECLHGDGQGDATMRRLCDPGHGLALRLARHCRAGERLPCLVDSGAAAIDAGFRDELRDAGFDNVLLHGSGALAGGSTVFALFGLPARAGARQAYFLELLLPHLHLALLRLSQQDRAGAKRCPAPAAMARALSAREAEILGWVHEGKTNYEMGRILGISELTVKNHLQRIYRTLGVSNRTHALARCLALRLLEAPAVP